MTELETVAGFSGTLLMIGMLLSVTFVTGCNLLMLCTLLIFGICVSIGIAFPKVLNNGRGAGFNVGGSLVICAVDGFDIGINFAIPLSIRAIIAGGNLFTCGGDGIDFLKTVTFDLGKIFRFDMTFTLVRPGTGRFVVAFVLVFDTAASASFGRLIRCNFFTTFGPFPEFGFGRFSNIFGFGINGGRFEYGNDNRRAIIGALRRDIE